MRMTKMIGSFVCFTFLLSSLSLLAEYVPVNSFNDPQGRFSLQLGPHWLMLPMQAQGELGHYAYAQNGIVAAELSIASETLPMMLTAAQYAQAVEENTLKSLPQYQKIQAGPFNLSGLEGYYYQFSMLKDTQMGSQPMIAEQYFWTTGTTGFMITFMVLTPQAHALKPALDQVIQSLQWGGATQMPMQNPQNPQTMDLNALYQQYQQQQQQMMQQYMQMYAQQNPNMTNNPYGQNTMPSGDLSALVQQQMQLAQLKPPSVPMNPQNQMLMNPQNIQSYPTVNSGNVQAPVTANNPFLSPSQNAPSTPNVYAPLQTPAPPNQGNEISLQSYEDPQGRFSILIPQGFTPFPSPAVTFQGPQGEVLNIAEVPGMTDELINTVLAGKEIQAKEEIQVRSGTQNVAATKVLFMAKNPQTGQSFVTAALFIKEKNIFLSFTVPQNLSEQERNMMQKVLASFEMKG
ncbi:MAG: hypothetical protein HYS08_02635 [Chlamydiae bacterium]|nr:hypothetical protein [Chlamydiota bacterium]MBI3266627.1 hypothetical protein [Chlamydiota bacterium]